MRRKPKGKLHPSTEACPRGSKRGSHKLSDPTEGAKKCPSLPSSDDEPLLEDDAAADISVQQEASGQESSSDEEDFELEDKSEVEIRNDLSTMSFEELQALKEKIGLKMYKEAVFGVDSKRAKKSFKRDNKNRPREMSAKHQVPVYREVFQAKKKVHQDPRFSSSAGEFNERVFRQTYSFVQDIKAKERKELEAMLHEERDPQQRKVLKGLLQKMKNQEVSEQLKAKKAELEKQYHKYLIDHQKEGEKPMFLNKTEKRKIQLAEKFKELKKAGKLEKYLEKKRKKNAGKERKHLPALN